MAAKLNIRSHSLEELNRFFTSHGQPAYRSKQVENWVWKKGAKSFAEMTNLPEGLRGFLETHFTITELTVSDKQISRDGTIKNAFTLHDGKVVEGVLIPADGRMTACISSQVGCSLSCAFCATGKLKRMRNLDADEIFDQVAAIKDQALEHYKTPLTNIVYMGMGEPLLNYKAVLASVERITSPEGLGMSPKRITVSTAGIAKMIAKLGDDQVKFNLALSLHAANEEKRSQIMPINDQNSLDSLAAALNYFYSKTKSRVTFEYIVFDNFNDTLKDAAELAAFCKRVPSKVNIIEYNPIDNGEYQQARPEKVDAFAQFLEQKDIVVNIRRSRGKDIDAACGQLANKNKVANTASVS